MYLMHTFYTIYHLFNNDMKTEIQQLKYEMQQVCNEMRNSINNNNTKQQKKRNRN